MVAIKDMEMPTDCKKCPLVGTDGNPKNLLSPMMCIAIWATKHEIKHCVGGMILDDCPLVEIEERKVGEWEDIHDKEEWYGDQFKCSVCGWITLDNGLYCPNCGAKMKGNLK